MVFRGRIFSFFIILLGTPVYLCLDSTKTKACKAVFSPDAMKTTCCPPMKQFVDRIAECQEKSGSATFSCSVSVCVTSVYGITTNGKIDEAKCRALLKRLTKENPASKPLNDEIQKNCLNGKYKQYVTSDPKCDTMKYQICAYVNYLMGCQKFNTSPRSCKTLSQNVGTCKPVLQQYLKEINLIRC